MQGQQIIDVVDEDQPLGEILADMEDCRQALEAEQGLWRRWQLRRELTALQREFADASDAAIDARIQAPTFRQRGIVRH